jgi:hypothetical protein
LNVKSIMGGGSEAIKKCSNCGAALNQYNIGRLCFPCQKKESERLAIGDSPTYDVNHMGRILRLNSEQVRRKARNGELPPRVPAARRWLWSKGVVERWINSEGQLPKGAAQQLTALAAAHGGLHFNEENEQWKVGKREVVTPIVSDKSGPKTAIYTQLNDKDSD